MFSYIHSQIDNWFRYPHQKQYTLLPTYLTQKSINYTHMLTIPRANNKHDQFKYTKNESIFRSRSSFFRCLNICKNQPPQNIRWLYVLFTRAGCAAFNLLTSSGKKGACSETQIALQKSAAPNAANVNNCLLVNFEEGMVPFEIISMNSDTLVNRMSMTRHHLLSSNYNRKLLIACTKDDKYTQIGL